MKLENSNIVFVSNALANGGAARVICTLAKEFSHLGYSVGIAIYCHYEGEYETPDTVKKEYGPEDNGMIGKVKRVRWVREVAKRNPNAVIIAFEYFVNMQVILACLGLKNKVIVSERNDPSIVGNDKDPMRKFLYRRADMLVCQTQDAADYFHGVPRKCVIPNPVREGLPEPWNLERRHEVVTFCRLEPQKNLGMLLQAFAVFSQTHPDWILEIYGDGKERSTLVELATKLEITEKVHINHARADVHYVVRDAGMFVLPSDHEGLSNSMLEAMAMGLPVICTDCPCGGARMIIRDGVNGYLIPVGDTVGLIERMEVLANNPTLGSDMGAAATETCRSLSATAVADKWLEVIE